MSPPVEALPVESPAELWRRVLSGFEAKRPRFGALLAHAEVATMTAGTVTLVFPDKFSVDQVERARGEIETAISEALGQTTRVTLSVGGGKANGTAVRSEVGQQQESAAADRRARELEARQHPLIRSAQDVFGAALKEVKT